LGGKLVEVNPAACRMYGYRYEELLTLSPARLLAQEDQDLQQTMLDSARAGQATDVRAIGLRKDQSRFPVEIHAAAFSYHGTQHLLMLVRDVTDQLQTYQVLEQRVEERTRELAMLLEVSHTITTIFDPRQLLDLVVAQ